MKLSIKHLPASLLAALLATAVLLPRDASALTIAKQGKAACVIVLPDAPTETVRFAADQLKHYLDTITGAEIPIVPPNQIAGRAAIHVGPTATAKTRLAAHTPKSKEGFLIHCTNSEASLCGWSDRGTLFGVYRFLETHGGCRWLAPDVERVPSQPDLSVAPIETVSFPEFDMRLFITGGKKAQISWGLKMGMNGLYSADSSATNGACFFPPPENSSCHSYCRIIPGDTYFAEHPEWFPLVSGQRRPGNMHGVQLCVTAKGLADEFAKNVIALFDKYPHCPSMSISPNDGRGWCECDVCQALDQKLCGGRTTKQGLAAERPFRGDRVFWFANEVARRVAVKHPDKLLLVLSYINYAEPPDTIKPAPNVVPWLCHYAPADYSRSIADPASEANAQFNELLTRWSKTAPHLLFYSYVSKSMWWRLPRPIVRNFAADLKHLHSLGIRRYYCQSRLSDWVTDGPLYYVLAQLMWDPSLDPEALAADWITHMFGEAAPAMAKFYADVEASVKSTGQSYSDNPPRHVPGLYDPELLQSAMRRLDEALALAKTPETEQRVREVRKIFRYGCLVISGLENIHAYTANADPEAATAGRRDIDQALKIYNRGEVRKFRAQLRFTEAMGVVAKGWSDIQKKGGKKCWNTDETGVGDNRAGWATFLLRMPRDNKGALVRMLVWGESELPTITINTGGQGKSYADKGIWTPVAPRAPLDGNPAWQWLEFDIPRGTLAPGDAPATLVGMGGSDSQIWVAKIEIQPLDK